MTLPIKQVYIDSRFKTKDSKSNSNFKFELKQTIQLPDNCVAYIDDIIIPHTWRTVEEFNNKIYMREYDTTIGLLTDDRILTIPSQNYTGELLATAILAQINANYSSSNYTCEYKPRKGTIVIQVTDANKSFLILSDDEIADQLEGSWAGPSYNLNNPKSMNEVLRNSLGNPANTFESGFLDLKNIHNIYISSPNLGSFSTLGPRGECNIIKKVPVSSDYGYSIFDNVVASHDYIDVSKQLLSVIEFKLSSARGDVVPLHGAHCSFSICFSTLKQDI